MGCDIHMFVEKQKKDGSWAMLKHDNPYYGKWKGEKKKTIYLPDIHRDYNLFAILANVRNGYGFAGIDTGDGFVPIKEIRGVPEDASKDYLHELADWGSDAHSETWYTLKELIQYNWAQYSTIQRFYVDAQNYQLMKEGKDPHHWSGDVFGKNIEKISNEEMDEYLEDGCFPLNSSNYFTQMSIGKTYRDCVHQGFFDMLDRFNEKYDSDKIRFLMFFDN